MFVCFLESKQLLDDIKTQISQVTSSIPLSALTNALGALNEAQGEIVRLTPDIERAEDIR